MLIEAEAIMKRGKIILVIIVVGVTTPPNFARSKIGNVICVAALDTKLPCVVQKIEKQ